MINISSIKTLAALRPDGKLSIPDSIYSFAAIPGTVFRLLGLPTAKRFLPEDAWDHEAPYQHVVLCLVDSLGWNYLTRLEGRLSLFESQRSVLSKISAQFPSTTVAHVTTLNSGLPAAEHGCFEWFYYEPVVDRVIAPLPFCYSGDRLSGTLTADGFKGTDLFPSRTLYHELNEYGVECFVHQQQQFAFTPYSLTVTKGAAVSPFKTLDAGCKKIVDLLSSHSRSSYHYLYADVIDSHSHAYGPESSETTGAVFDTLRIIEESLFRPLAALHKKIALVLIADHGHVPIDPKTTIYINKIIPGLTDMFSTSRDGAPLLFGGSSRDLFLYVKEENRPKCMAELRGALEGVAEVLPIEDLMERQVFGSQNVSELLRSRAGNVVILPFTGESVYWYEPGRFVEKRLGHHGGLTSQELEVPFLLMPLGV